MLKINNRAHVALAVIIILAAVSACERDAAAPAVDLTGAVSPFATFRDIPGVTAQEIAAIEALQRENKVFIYGMTLSTEAFPMGEDEGGKYSVGGYSALLCEWLTDLFGMRFQPGIFAWGNLVEKLNVGELDFAGNMTPIEERKKIYYMTDPVAERQYKIIQLEKSVPLDRIAMTRPLRYVFIEGAAIAATVASVTDKDTYEAVFVDNYEEAYHALENGIADAFIGDSAVILSFDAYGGLHEGDFLPLIFSPVSMATAKLELEPVISVLTKAQRNGAMPYLNNLYNQGYSAYRRHKLFMLLNDEEKAYLRNTVTVPVAARSFNYPVDFYNSYEKKWEGIAFDILRKVEDLTGLGFEVINAHDVNLPGLVVLVREGKAHIIPELLFSEERKPHFIWMKNHFITDQYALLSKSHYPNVGVNEISHKRVGVIKDTVRAELFRTWFPNAVNVMEYSLDEDALHSLEQGEIDLIMASTNRLLSILNYYELSDYKANFLFSYPYESTFGFNKDQTVLCSIMDKALPFIDTHIITEQWMTKTYDFRSRLLSAQRPWLIGAAVMSLTVLGLILILFYRSRNEGKRLAGLVGEKTSTLTAILDSTPDLIFCKDLDSRITECNKATEKYFNCLKEDILGKDDTEAFGMHPEMAAQYVAVNQKIFSERQMVIVEEMIPSFDGKQRFFETKKMPLILDGKVAGLVIMAHDITHRKEMARRQEEAEAKAREADEWSMLMLNSMPLGSGIWTKDGKMIVCNEEAARLFDLKEKNEFIERFGELSPEYQPDGRPSLETAIANVGKAFEEGYCRFEWTHRKLNGEPLPVEVSLIRIKYRDDYRVVGYFRDLRELKESMAKMREADVRAQLMLEEAPLTIMLWDKNVTILDCNMVAVRVFGLSSKKEYIERFFSLAPEFQPNGMTSGEIIQKEIAKVFQEGYARFDWTHYHGVTGELIPFEITWVRVEYKGEYVALSYAQDLRDRNAAMAKMREADERVQIIFDTAPLASCMYDKNGDLIDCNHEIVKMFEIPDKDYYFKRAAELSPEYQPDGTLSAAQADYYGSLAIEKGFQRFEWTHRKMNGELFPTEITLVRVNYKGDYVVTGYIRDLTEQRAIVQLAKQQTEAEAANKAKSSFLASMSHEIRTPMNAILGITEIQLQNKLPAETRNALNIIYNSGYSLLGIINDLLDLSKIEAGKLELVNERYETASMINDTINLNTARIGSKPIEFKLHVDKDLPFELIGDELRVKQILNNLLSNALKYTDSGEVRLSFSAELIGDESGNAEGENAPKVTLTITVRDTGQGMTEEQVRNLFDAYSRFNMKANRFVEGTGLGMNIVQQLVEMMDGDIAVASEPGKGTEFTVRLKQGYAGPARLGEELAENLKGFRLAGMSKMKKAQIMREPMPYGNVLVVDDMETNLYVAKGFLLPYGLKVDTALSGSEAIRKIEGGNAYDIVFMDHMMPVMDGIETVKAIRAKGYARPIVALTANAVAGQVEVFMANGFDGFISKPIDIRELNASLNKFVRDRQPPEVVEAARATYGGNVADGGTPQLDPELAKIFTRDAEKTIAILREYEARNAYAGDNLQTYIVNVHALKSALANIGETKLSGIAKELEQAGRDRNVGVIAKGTPELINALISLIEKLKPAEEEEDLRISEEDAGFLRDKLMGIKEACAEFDNVGVEAALKDLKGKKWPNNVKAVLDDIAMHILHSDFDEAVAVCADYLSDMENGRT